MKTSGELYREVARSGNRTVLALVEKIHANVDGSVPRKLKIAAYACELLAMVPVAILSGCERIAQAIEDRK